MTLGWRFNHWMSGVGPFLVASYSVVVWFYQQVDDSNNKKEDRTKTTISGLLETTNFLEGPSWLAFYFCIKVLPCYTHPPSLRTVSSLYIIPFMHFIIVYSKYKLYHDRFIYCVSTTSTFVRFYLSIVFFYWSDVIIDQSTWHFNLSKYDKHMVLPSYQLFETNSINSWFIIMT